MTSAESTQTSRLQVNFDDYVKVGDTDCDNGLAGKRLNCEYSGPPKSAREDPEILEILQQICPHLVVEVREDALKKNWSMHKYFDKGNFSTFFSRLKKTGSAAASLN